MNERIVAQNVLVAGIPGSGKTEYCRWLEREKGFLHLDFDELLTGHGTEEKLALIEQLRRTAEEFVFAISKQGKPIVIDWGFPLGSLSWCVSSSRTDSRCGGSTVTELQPRIVHSKRHRIPRGFQGPNGIDRKTVAAHQGRDRRKRDSSGGRWTRVRNSRRNLPQNVSRLRVGRAR
jgi:hypothetical protein